MILNPYKINGLLYFSQKIIKIKNLILLRKYCVLKKEKDICNRNFNRLKV